MTDIIVVMMDEFISKKESYYDLSLSTKTKIEDILNKHDCFKEEFLPPQIKQSIHHKTKTQSIVKTFSKKRFVSQQDRLNREVISLLNKLNKCNFIAISQRIYRCCDRNTFIEILDTIVKKCAVEETYIDVYINLIHGLNSIFNLDLILCKYIKDFVYNLSSTIEHLDNTSHIEYDDFCIYVLNRKKLFAMNVLFIKLIQKKLITCYDSESYIQDILSNVNDNLCKSLDHYLDVYTGLLKVLVVSFGKHQDIIDTVSYFLPFCKTQKTKFVILELQQYGSQASYHRKPFNSSSNGFIK